MIEFIGNNIRDISYWLMFLAMVGAYILLHCQKKAYRRLDETHQRLRLDLLRAKIDLNSIVNTVKEFIDRHNEWHDRKIRFYYDKDGWHCCYADEMPQSDTFIDQEEITPQNKNNNENQQSI